MKRLVIIITAIVAVLLAIFKIRSIKNFTPTSGQEIPNAKINIDDEKNTSREQSSVRKKVLETQTSTKYKLILLTPPKTTITKTNALPLEGFGDSAVLKNKSGEILWDAKIQKRALYSSIVSPDGSKVILSFENGIFEIFNMNPFQKIKSLPNAAPIRDGDGFESWYWLDFKRLIGVSSQRKSEDQLKGLTASEQEANSIDKTLLYAYDIESDALNYIDSDLPSISQLFEVKEVRVGGYILLKNDTDEYNEIWVKVILNK